MLLSTAGTITGHISLHAARSTPKQISIDSDARCPHTGTEETVRARKSGNLANAFVYIQSGFRPC
jgi:hypothetical protein